MTFNPPRGPLGKLLAALLLIGTSLPQGSAYAQVAGAARNAAARAAARSVEQGAATRVVARQKVSRPACAAIANKCAGIRREAAARRVLSGKYPNERIQSETYLLDRNGRRAIDPQTGKGRRVDFVLFSRDGHTRRFEVTSQRADKRAQLAREQRIQAQRRSGSRRTGPVYVRDRATGKLVPVGPQPSKVIRFK